MAEPNSQESINLNVRVRKTAKELAQLIASELEQYEEPQRRLIAEIIKRFIGKRFLGEPRQESAKPKQKQKQKPNEVEAFLEYCSECIAAAGDIPTEGQEFAQSVAEKIASIRDTVSRLSRVTPGQQQAVDNMCAGIDNWLNRD